MKSVLCLSAVWVMSAAALAQADAFKECDLGQRVEITFKAGHTLRGELCKPRGWEKYDLHKDIVVALNVTLEYLRLDGQVAIEKQTVKSVRKLAALSPDEVQKILNSKSKALSQLNREEQARIQAQLEQFDREKQAKSKSIDEKLEDLSKDKPSSDEEKAKKALEIYATFPESEGWGPEKYKVLEANLIPSGQKDPKYLDVRKPIAAGHGPNTGARTFSPADKKEEVFYDNYELWIVGRELSKKAQPAPPKPEEPKPEGEPKPEEKKGGS
jgi:hypothetical protein